jgi:hypothetical protein
MSSTTANVCNMESESDEIQLSAPVKLSKKDGSITKNKKKNSVPRATPRPYKNLSMERLESTIETLRERVEVTDNRLQTYNIRLRKLNSEMVSRKAAEKE